MNQGKSVNFSVIKQKIIKTDEVLRLYMETNNKLKSVQETCKAYKLKHDQTALNLSRLQLENERCSFNLENVKSKCELLEKENEKLQEQKSTLEDKYNQQIVQSQLNIKELENELRMLQEIKTTAERFSPKKKRNSSIVNENNKKIKELEDKIKQLEESGTNSKNEVMSLNVQNKKLSNDIIVTEKKHADIVEKLQNENSDLLEELNKLKCQINKANANLEAKSKHETTLENLNKEKDIKISELHEKICTLVVDENKLKIIEKENEMLRQKLEDPEIHLTKENNSTKDICLQTDELTKNHTRTVHIQTLESMKTFSQQDSISSASSNLETKSKHETALENLNKEKDIEISELHKKICTLVADENRLKIIEEENKILRLKLMDQEERLAKENNSTKDICLQTDKLTKNQTRTIRIQTLESMKTLSQQDSISSENRKLKQTILNRDAEIFKLKAKSKVNTKHCHTQTEILEYDVESVENILLEMRNPFSMLSPMSTSCENLNLDDILSPIPGNVNDSCPALPDIPDIVITPPTPIKEKDFEKFTDFQKNISVPPTIDENISPLEQLEKTNMDNSKNSEELENKGIKDNFKKVPRRKLFIDDNFIKLRKSCLKRILNKRYVFKKEMRRARRLSKQDCILKALRTLKHSNINFTITNQSNVPKWWTNYSNYDSFKCPEVLPDSNQRRANNLRKTSISTEQNKSTHYVTEKLNCISKNCNDGNSCMLLNNAHGITELLGFFNIKNENITPSSSRIGNIADSKHLNCSKSSNPTGGSGMTPENLLETLADLVSQKLRQKRNFSKRKQKVISENSDSFYSETETEIERLFATPDDNVLRRNKMLLKKAKEQNLKESVFAPNLERDITDMKHANADSKITLSKLAHSFEGTQGSETEINSFGLDDTTKIENEDASNTIELNPTNECIQNSSGSFKYSTCPSETNKNMVKSPSAKSVNNKSPGCNGSTKEEEKLENYNEKMFVASTDYEIFNERTESRNSFQYYECPEIISPLSSVRSKDSPQSKSIQSLLQTEETKSPLSPKCLKFLNHQNKPNPLNYSQSNSDKLLIRTPASIAYINKYICNEKVMNEQLITFIDNFEEGNSSIEDRTTPITHKKLNSSSDKPNRNKNCKIFPKNSQKNISLMEQEELPNERDIVEDNFAMEINELGNTATQINSSSLSANYSFNIDETAEQIVKNGIQEGNQNIPSIKKESDISLGIINSSLKESLNLLNEREETFIPTKSKQVARLSSPLSISTAQFSEGYTQYQCNNRDSREFMEYKQFERDISFSDSIYPVQGKLSSSPIKKITKEILNVLPDTENNSNNLSEFNEIENVPSCPQSPIMDYEDHGDIKSPKIIPLENVENTPNESENIPSCPQSPVMDYEDHVDIKSPKIIPLENVENTPNESENIPSCPQLPVIDYKEHMDMLPKVENIPSYPQSPIIDYEEHLNVLPKVENTPPINNYEEDMDIKVPKIIPLEKLFEQDAMIGLDGNTTENMLTSHYFPKREEIKACETKIIFSDNAHNEQISQVILDILPKVENTPTHQQKTTEIEDIPSCPQSPVIGYKEHMDVLPKVENTPSHQSHKIENIGEKLSFTLSKTMLSEQLNDPYITDDFDKRNSTDDISIRSKSPESNDERDKHIPIPPLNNYQENTLDFTNNKEYWTTKGLKTTAVPVLPTTLRRSKRICKRVIYSELFTENSSEDCETDNNSEGLTDNSKSEDISKTPQVDSDKSLNESSIIVSETSLPIKRKRGRPRKYSIVESNSKHEETKALSLDNTNCDEKHLENSVLCIESQEKISNDKNLKELSQEENLIEKICVEPVEENIKSDMFVDESNSEIKPNVSKSTPDYYSGENRATNISEKQELHNELLTDEEENRITNLSEKQELHNELLTDEHNDELLTDTNFKEKIVKNNVAKKRKRVSKEAVVRKRKSRKDVESPNITLEMTSDTASEEERTTSYLETNELHDDLIMTDETDSEEINDENNGKEEKLNNTITTVTKSEKNESLSSDIVSLISDIISKEKRKISLCDESVPPTDALTIEIDTKKNSDENNTATGKVAGKNAVRKRKIMSTLKSNIIKQFRMKRKMFQMDVDVEKKTNTCDLKINRNSDRSNIKKTNTNVGSSSKSNTTQGSNISESTNVDNSESNRDDKRIHIVQNIMIPANSCYAVDLMEKKRFWDSNFPLNCDIRLDVAQTPSQCDVKFTNPPLHKKKIADSISDNNIPNKRNRKVPAKLGNTAEGNSDILSKILGEMDKIKPNNPAKSVVTPSLPEQTMATSIEDKDWRKGIITIAESIYNVATEKEDFRRPTTLGNRSKMKLSMKQKILMSRLSRLSTEDNIPDEIILEFKRLTEEKIAELILHRVSQDTTDKPTSIEDKYPTPLMTKTQRILLGLMVRLKNENVPNIFNTFLSKADTLLFGTGCGIRSIIPITRLYLAICRLQADIDRMRNFCCDAFYFLDNRAIPVLFAVLTSWMEVLPKEPDLKYFPLAKVLVQIVHLRTCNTPGYNLLPLRSLLHQYHGYPTERWNCDELFKELFQQYLRNPVKSAALRLLFKNKDMQWTFKKINESLKPLVYKIPAENVNFRATVIVLIGDICSQFKPKGDSEKASWKELEWWLNSLMEGEESDLIEKSVNYSLNKIRLKTRKVSKKNLQRKIMTEF